MKTQIKDILQDHKGRANTITGKELASVFGMKSDRPIRLIIRELISEGMPIASTTEAPAGYFLAVSYAEARDYAESVKSRLINDAIRRRDFNRAADMQLQQLVQGRLV